MNKILLWVIFNACIIGLLLLDLGVFHKKGTSVSVRQALKWSAVWICLAMLFNAGLWFFRGAEPALQFLTCYLMEKSLSIDNVFVFLMIFTYFRVPSNSQHSVLFFGIFGALIMRALVIFAGVELVSRFKWAFYLFGAFLVFTGVKFAKGQSEEIDPEKNPALRLLRRFLPVTHNFHAQRFFVRENARLVATPLFVTLVAVEASDVVFALDSIPAALAITLDPFIIFSANVFAILGLRALYFAIAGLLQLFHYLHYGLAVILIFVGMKMLVAGFFHMPLYVTLFVILTTLSLCVILSIKYPKMDKLEEQLREEAKTINRDS